MLLIPGLPKIYVKDKEFTRPDDPVFYLLTGSGLFKGHNMDCFSSLGKLEDGIRGLEEQDDELDLRLAEIPRFLIERAVGFFVEVYEEHRSEAVLLIHYHPQKQHYRFVAPPQTINITVYPWYEVVKDEVEYENVPPVRGYQQIGSIHSHGAMPAFQSWQDDEDGRFNQGLHIVVGSLNWRPKFNVVFSVAGRQFELKLEDVAEGFEEPIRPAPKFWWQQVRVKKTPSRSYRTYKRGGDYGYDDYGATAAGYGEPYDGYGARPD